MAKRTFRKWPTYHPDVSLKTLGLSEARPALGLRGCVSMNPVEAGRGAFEWGLGLEVSLAGALYLALFGQDMQVFSKPIESLSFPT